MPKIDTSSWGNFLISDVFETNKKGKSIQVPTGANIQKKDLKDGAIPRITVTGVNNGVFGYFEDIPNNDNYRIYENFISVSFLGTVFYQESKASLDMKVHCLKPLCHTLNKYTGEFLVTAILASLKESSYSDQISSTVLPMLSIKLPINSQGKPDWQYMEDYMRNIEVRVSDSISKLESAQGVENSKIDVSSWGEFVVGSLFDADRGKVKSLQTLKDGNTPVIAAAMVNQGVAGYYNVQAIFENKITVSCNGGCGSTFYHPYKFNINGDAIVLTELKPMSDNVKQFIACVLDGVLTRKYSYNEKCSADKAKAEIIKLPIDSNGEPDWQYMEDYMRNIEVRVSTSISKLESVLYSSEVSDLENSVSVILKGGE